MLRPALYLLLIVVAVILAGCTTGEVKNTNDFGLSNGTPSGTSQSQYGSGRGDSIGGGGAAPPLDASQTSDKELGTGAKK
jgi:hypothetical protein